MEGVGGWRGLGGGGGWGVEGVGGWRGLGGGGGWGVEGVGGWRGLGGGGGWGVEGGENPGFWKNVGRQTAKGPYREQAIRENFENTDCEITYLQCISGILGFSKSEVATRSTLPLHPPLPNILV